MFVLEMTNMTIYHPYMARWVPGWDPGHCTAAMQGRIQDFLQGWVQMVVMPLKAAVE